MATTRTGQNMVVAREAVTIVVGATPAVYRPITVTDRRTGERRDILDTDNEAIDPGDLGTPYTFKANERVSRNHPAVKEAPGAFVSLEEAEGED